MAKQTFTTGQVLTAAQMTSLQQTAMGGGSATAKIASYVLVAADAGGTVAMNAAGATTITVNTGLFAAGDTVFIQNLGAGACTVTAGTATVATAGSLILPQNDAGILYFTATGAAIFYDYIQAGAVSPLTTKGDLYTFSTSDARLGVGANGTTLVADSSEATGLKWATATSGGMTLINSGGTTLTGSSVLISSIPATYKNLELVIRNYLPATDDREIRIRINDDSNANRHYFNETLRVDASYNATSIFASPGVDNGVTQGLFYYNFFDYANTTTWKLLKVYSLGNRFDTTTNLGYLESFGAYNQTDAISSLRLFPNSGNFTSGTAYLYGVS
jgi:hypothetical protein